MKKTFIYDDAKDKNVAVTVVYANETNELFYDAECTVEVPAEDGLDLFVKGVVALKSDEYYKPVSCSKDGVLDFGL